MLAGVNTYKRDNNRQRDQNRERVWHPDSASHLGRAEPEAIWRAVGVTGLSALESVVMPGQREMDDSLVGCCGDAW